MKSIIKNGPEEDGSNCSTFGASTNSKFTPSHVSLCWEVFENVCTLGTGAFGDVYKVKCLQSSHLSDGSRTTMNSVQIKKAKSEMITAISNNGG
jgi:hypothetical protein